MVGLFKLLKCLLNRELFRYLSLSLSLSLSHITIITTIIQGCENKKDMNGRMCYFLIASLQILSCVSAAIRPFPPYDGGAHHQEKIPQSPQAAFHSKQGLERMEGVAYADDEVYRGLSRLGSMPPSCVHKCGSCIPCYAIQIRTNTNHFGVQYANYEPEGWKCKCGTSFFNP